MHIEKRKDDIVLDVSGVSINYGTVPAVRGASFQVRGGQIVTLIGANGAGKSTLMKYAAGLVTAQAGSVKLNGRALDTASADTRVRHGLCLVPEGRRLFGSMTVRENLELGAYCRDDARAISADLERCLDYFPDLVAKLGAPAGTLSGGQQQMVAVARALMAAPRVLLLDEPTIGLAPAVVEKIAQVIHVIRDTGVDVLLVEQNAEVALRIADYAYVLEGGTVVQHGDARALAGDEGVQRAYLGM
ncbi:branched chain amino acid ABC transporter ATPase [Caballeronia cordobensis]|uniref:Branched chain amino acid ABC transporter ATPase n=1 Tax=Caballeronia cordobensis TaxID=1353886 RepID=A0A158G7K8_CABCO|nr:ABC transporter ATP-binding protein [Caballeronia cordobensis]SAL27847.1 branched chain amino acid ABC transporter ATPase [Caballeronia cordobensis]